MKSRVTDAGLRFVVAAWGQIHFSFVGKRTRPALWTGSCCSFRAKPRRHKVSDISFLASWRESPFPFQRQDQRSDLGNRGVGSDPFFSCWEAYKAYFVDGVAAFFARSREDTKFRISASWRLGASRLSNSSVRINLAISEMQPRSVRTIQFSVRSIVSRRLLQQLPAVSRRDYVCSKLRQPSQKNLCHSACSTVSRASFSAATPLEGSFGQVVRYRRPTEGPSRARGPTRRSIVPRELLPAKRTWTFGAEWFPLHQPKNKAGPDDRFHKRDDNNRHRYRHEDQSLPV